MRCPAPSSDIFSIVFQTRQISADQLGLLADWLDTKPVVPVGQWFKKFPEMIVCGEGELVKTVLTKEQIPFGEEVV